jgi:hypothetical protein
MLSPFDQIIYDATRGLADAPEGARLIPLTKGFFAVVDGADFERVSALRWCAQVKASGQVYAVRDSQGVRWHLHRFVASAPEGMDVDHWNGIGLDDRGANLTICTRAENLRKARPRYNATGFKGVQRVSVNCYQAKIAIEGKKRHLGCFPTATEAAAAYDRAAKQWHGHFARLNFDHLESAPVVHVQEHEPGESPWIYSKSIGPS